MAELRVLVNRPLDDGRIVVTNDGPTPVPLGAWFTELASETLSLSEGTATRQQLTARISVRLQVTEIETWRQKQYEVPRGHSAALRFEGQGLAELHGLVVNKERSVFALLRGGATEA